jgi:hypothetical protein
MAELVHRLVCSWHIAAGQLAVFKGARAKRRYLDHNGRASNTKNSQLAPARRVAIYI